MICDNCDKPDIIANLEAEIKELKDYPIERLWTYRDRVLITREVLEKLKKKIEELPTTYGGCKRFSDGFQEDVLKLIEEMMK